MNVVPLWPVVAVVTFLLLTETCAFSPRCISISSLTQLLMETKNQSPHPFCELPGDPSLMITTNVDLGAKKMGILKDSHTQFLMDYRVVQLVRKPCKNTRGNLNLTSDKADVIFGGTDDPTALGCMYSIGAIAMESNGKIHASVSDLLEPFGIDSARIYINFFDVPRANVGWSRKTFAG